MVRKKLKVKLNQININGDNKWPYCDSYAPKLKLVKDDLIPVKDRLYKKNRVGVLSYD